VATCSTILFGTLSALGILRVAEEDEVRGLDESKHGGSAYRSSTGNKTDEITLETHTAAS